MIELVDVLCKAIGTTDAMVPGVVTETVGDGDEVVMTEFVVMWLVGW